MKILGFHVLSAEDYDQLNQDLKTAKREAAGWKNEYEGTVKHWKEVYSQKYEEMLTARKELGEAITAGDNLRKLLDGVEAELESQRALLESANEFHVRREATLKGQITKLKKRLSNA